MYIYKSQRLYKFTRYEIPMKRDILSPSNQKYINDLKNYLQTVKTGKGLINKILKNLPLPEMHLSLPSNISCEKVPNGSFNTTGKYSFCGPGTKVEKRLKEGYQGVNSLDKACKQHDLYYMKYKTTKERNIADDILARDASNIAMDETEPDYVRRDARAVTGIMGLKSRFGMGSKNVKFCPQRKTVGM